MDGNDYDFSCNIGQKIRNLRIGGGKSQAELGTILGLTFQQVQKYEKGYNNISAEKLWRVAQYFQVDIEHFFEDANSALGAGRPGQDPFTLGMHSDENDRLRLEIGRRLHAIKTAKILRGLLKLVRTIVEPSEAKLTG